MVGISEEIIRCATCSYCRQRWHSNRTCVSVCQTETHFHLMKIDLITHVSCWWCMAVSTKLLPCFWEVLEYLQAWNWELRHSCLTNLSSNYTVCTFAVEMAVMRHSLATELMQEVGRHVTIVTERIKISIPTSLRGCPEGNAVSFPYTVITITTIGRRTFSVAASSV